MNNRFIIISRFGKSFALALALRQIPPQSCKNDFPLLEISSNVRELNCDSCRFAKNYFNIYLKENEKRNIHFEFFHTGIWYASLTFVQGNRFFFYFY